MKITLFFLILFNLAQMPSIYTADYHMDFTKYGPASSSGGGQGQGIDLSYVFHESPEVKRMQARARKIDQITASVSGANQRIKVKTKAIKRLKGIVKKRNSIRKRVKRMDHPKIRTGFVNIATDSIAASRDYYIANAFESGMIAANIAETALDLATSFTPGISWARDFYEAFSGKHLISGAELDSFDRGTAVFGVVTLGLGSKIGKVFKVLPKIMKGRTAGQAVEVARKIVDSAGKNRWSKVFDSGFTPKRLLDSESMQKMFRNKKGIPEDWVADASKRGEGIRFHRPGSNRADEIRVMPGNPNSPHVNSQKSYVTWKKNGKWHDKNGNVLPNNKQPEAHIPVDEFTFQ
ncbi:MAG: pre-toxin TG domain-containing protein [Nitrospinae bacterium]|nr:pre-toxin TG domain-containing protein [Nitrospinota bacterium]